MTDSTLEAISAAVHDGWMDSKLAQGITSRQSETGEELMTDYDALSEDAKDLDRGTVRSVLAAVERLGGRVELPS